MLLQGMILHHPVPIQPLPESFFSFTFNRTMISRLLLFLFLFSALVVQGQISIPDASFTYTQDFDGLANSGTGNTWTDNTTIAGWYANRVAYNASTGSSNTGAMYSFGATSDTERSLGSVGSGGTGTVYYGVRLVNNTGATISQLTISYFGEQWRNGGNAATQDLTFSYQIGATSLTTGTWTDVVDLSFTSPIATATASALDGNDAANRTQLMLALVLNLDAGQEVWFRWQDLNDTGNDHGLSIDDFNISAVVLPVSFAAVKAYTASDGIDILFSTAEEINNDHFIVERSEDGHTFDALATIESKSSSEKILHYEYKDTMPIFGINYYRIKQVDYDGKYSYSQVVKSHFNTSRPDLFIFEMQGLMTIKSSKSIDKVGVYNISGQPIYMSQPASDSWEMDVMDWPPGMYLVQVSSQGHTIQTKIVKK